MFVIMAYDVGVKRSAKVLKTAKKYLRPIQKSVFEGFLTESQLKRMKQELQGLIDTEQDQITICRLPSEKVLVKDEIGKSFQREQLFL